jgi:hypothetical protein
VEGDGIAEFLLFVAVNHIFRGLFKTLGASIDARVTGGTSFYLLGELVSASNYCIYYRFLFTKIESSWIFVALQVVHLVMEWTTYPLRVTPAYFRLCDRVCARWSTTIGAKGGILRRILAPAPMELNVHDSSCFVCLDFALRSVVFLAMGGTFLVLLLLGRFAYNKQFYCLSTQTDQEFTDSLWYASLSLVTELLNLALMERAFWRKRHLSMLQRLFLLYHNKRFALFTVFIFAGIVHTAILSRLKVALIE